MISLTCIIHEWRSPQPFSRQPLQPTPRRTRIGIGEKGSSVLAGLEFRSKAKFTERGLLMLNNLYWYIRDLIFGPRLCTTLALCTTIRSLTLALLPLSLGYCLCPAIKRRLPYGVADVRLILWTVPAVKAEPK